MPPYRIELIPDLDLICYAAGINAQDHTTVMHAQENVAALPIGKGAYGIKQGVGKLRLRLFNLVSSGLIHRPYYLFRLSLPLFS